MPISNDNRKILLKIARASIKHGLEQGQSLNVDPSDYDVQLQAHYSSFVKLEIQHCLRGCVGALVANRPLVCDVAYHAYAAAFDDPHFPPLQARDYALLSVYISILSPLEPMYFDSEIELIRQLRPHVDGLVLEDKSHKAMFLPEIWHSLSNPQDFLCQLKRKAGLPTDYWSPTIKIQRYTTEIFHN